MINSELFQSIRSQLTHHPPRISEIDNNNNNDNHSDIHHYEEKQNTLHQSSTIKKPTQRLFIAIEKELTYKQNRIETLELEAEEKDEQFKLIANEITRLREESASIKRLNQQLSIRL